MKNKFENITTVEKGEMEIKNPHSLELSERALLYDKSLSYVFIPGFTYTTNSPYQIAKITIDVKENGINTDEVYIYNEVKRNTIYRLNPEDFNRYVLSGDDLDLFYGKKILSNQSIAKSGISTIFNTEDVSRVYFRNPQNKFDFSRNIVGFVDNIKSIDGDGMEYHEISPFVKNGPEEYQDCDALNHDGIFYIKPKTTSAVLDITLNLYSSSKDFDPNGPEIFCLLDTIKINYSPFAKPEYNNLIPSEAKSLYVKIGGNDIVEFKVDEKNCIPVRKDHETGDITFLTYNNSLGQYQSKNVTLTKDLIANDLRYFVYPYHTVNYRFGHLRDVRLPFHVDKEKDENGNDSYSEKSYFLTSSKIFDIVLPGLRNKYPPKNLLGNDNSYRDCNITDSWYILLSKYFSELKNIIGLKALDLVHKGILLSNLPFTWDSNLKYNFVDKHIQGKGEAQHTWYEGPVYNLKSTRNTIKSCKLKLPIYDEFFNALTGPCSVTNHWSVRNDYLTVLKENLKLFYINISDSNLVSDLDEYYNKEGFAPINSNIAKSVLDIDWDNLSTRVNKLYGYRPEGLITGYDSFIAGALAAIPGLFCIHTRYDTDAGALATIIILSLVTAAVCATGIGIMGACTAYSLISTGAMYFVLGLGSSTMAISLSAVVETILLSPVLATFIYAGYKGHKETLREEKIELYKQTTANKTGIEYNINNNTVDNSSFLYNMPPIDLSDENNNITFKYTPFNYNHNGLYLLDSDNTMQFSILNLGAYTKAYHIKAWHGDTFENKDFLFLQAILTVNKCNPLLPGADISRNVTTVYKPLELSGKKTAIGEKSFKGDIYQKRCTFDYLGELDLKDLTVENKYLLYPSENLYTINSTDNQLNFNIIHNYRLYAGFKGISECTPMLVGMGLNPLLLIDVGNNKYNNKSNYSVIPMFQYGDEEDLYGFGSNNYIYKVNVDTTNNKIGSFTAPLVLINSSFNHELTLYKLKDLLNTEIKVKLDKGYYCFNMNCNTYTELPLFKIELVSGDLRLTKVTTTGFFVFYIPEYKEFTLKIYMNDCPVKAYLSNMGIFKVNTDENTLGSLLNKDTWDSNVCNIPELESLVILNSVYCYNEEGLGVYDNEYEFRYLPENAWLRCVTWYTVDFTKSKNGCYIYGKLWLNTKGYMPNKLDNNYGRDFKYSGEIRTVN